ncbi:flagellar protein FlgN [Methylocella sp. CPCC 101449]|uniref:flagellar protein FlgN n=1 Tax=Methylocella sp. CPCC 101449 TaxID=2987531 RepID=UPI00288F98B9|nr:flagellar protein FlgN [Methylocella sp. CPCC 101449]MDT2021154.1 CorA family divalent cation transporter [Methylocella sp. CPCC 101449]
MDLQGSDLQAPHMQGSRLALDPSSQAAFRNAVTRLEQTLVQEIESLSGNDLSQLREFNDRKSRGLLDLMRVTRSVGIEDLDGESIDRLKSLRAILDENQRVITNHLVAAREISDVLAQAMESVESDGTYSERIGRERKG